MPYLFRMRQLIDPHKDIKNSLGEYARTYLTLCKEERQTLIKT